VPEYAGDTSLPCSESCLTILYAPEHDVRKMWQEVRGGMDLNEIDGLREGLRDEGRLQKDDEVRTQRFIERK